MRQKRFGFMGASSVLMIFIVLCLTAFGVLSLVSARADLRLTNKTVDAAEEYHRADARTDELLSVIDQKLADACAQVSDLSAAEAPARYTALLRDSLFALEGVRLDGDRVFLTVSMSDGREIRTELELLPPGERDRYRVLSRQLYAAADGNIEDGGLNVWPGF